MTLGVTEASVQNSTVVSAAERPNTTRSRSEFAPKTVFGVFCRVVAVFGDPFWFKTESSRGVEPSKAFTGTTSRLLCDRPSLHGLPKHNFKIRHIPVHSHKWIDLALLALTRQSVCINIAYAPDCPVRRSKRRTNPLGHSVATQKLRTGSIEIDVTASRCSLNLTTTLPVV